MNERVYNRIANILILIGIASALLFDSGKLPPTVVGTIGMIAGVAAIVLYFWNQHKIEANKKSAATASVLVGSIGESNRQILPPDEKMVVAALKAWREVKPLSVIAWDREAIDEYRNKRAR